MRHLRSSACHRSSWVRRAACATSRTSERGSRIRPFCRALPRSHRSRGLSVAVNRACARASNTISTSPDQSSNTRETRDPAPISGDRNSQYRGAALWPFGFGNQPVPTASPQTESWPLCSQCRPHNFITQTRHRSLPYLFHAKASKKCQACVHWVRPRATSTSPTPSTANRLISRPIRIRSSSRMSLQMRYAI